MTASEYKAVRGAIEATARPAQTGEISRLKQSVESLAGDNAALSKALCAAQDRETRLREALQSSAQREAALRQELAEARRKEDFMWQTLQGLKRSMQVLDLDLPLIDQLDQALSRSAGGWTTPGGQTRLAELQRRFTRRKLGRLYDEIYGWLPEGRGATPGDLRRESGREGGEPGRNASGMDGESLASWRYP